MRERDRQAEIDKVRLNKEMDEINRKRVVRKISVYYALLLHNTSKLEGRTRSLKPFPFTRTDLIYFIFRVYLIHFLNY